MSEPNVPNETAIRVEERAKNYYRSIRRSGQLTDAEYISIKQKQKEYLKQSAVKFYHLQHTPKLEMCAFTTIEFSHAESHFEFYAVKTTELGWRAEIQDRLNSFYNEFAEPIIEVEVNFVCAVNDNSQWYRGIVNDIIEIGNGLKRFIVLLMDYGRIVRKKQKHLAVLTGLFEHVAPFAMKCQLAHLNEDHRSIRKNQAVKDRLRERMEDLVENTGYGLIYWSVAEPPDILPWYKVVLFCDCKVEPERLFDGAYILNETYAAFDRTKVQIPNSMCKQWMNRPIHKWDYDAIYFGERIRVNISHVLSPSEIYVQYVEDLTELTTTLRQQIDQYVNEQSEQYHEPVQWAKGDACLVRAQNPNTYSIRKLWYRGRITAVVDDKLLVFLRDWGTLEMTTPDELLPISEHLAIANDYAKRCYIDKCNELNCAISVCAAFDLISAYRVFEMSIVRGSGDLLGITLWGTNSTPIIGKAIAWNNIGAGILSQVIVRNMYTFIRDTQRAYNREQSGNDGSKYFDRWNIDNKVIDEIEPVYRHEVVAVRSWPPAIQNTSNDFAGIIVGLNNMGIFYIQSDALRTQSDDLSERITKFVAENDWIVERSRNHEWQVGDACFSSYSSDNRYYRAIVRHVERDRCFCIVKYVDYGQYQKCHLDDLRLATEFGDIPILVNRYYIPEIVAASPSGKWFCTIWKTFVERFVGELCQIKVDRDTQVGMPIVPCSIIVHSIRTYGSIFTWMESNQLALSVKSDQNCGLTIYV